MSGDYRDFYRRRRVLITGGLGFIGSNLARALVDLDGDVLLVDSLMQDYGGNLFNIAGIEPRVRVNIADVREASTMQALVRESRGDLQPRGPGEPHRQHAGPAHRPGDQLSRSVDDSRGLPAAQSRDEGSLRGHAADLWPPDRLPVDESHLVRPTDINGINKAAGENYHLVYTTSSASGPARFGCRRVRAAPTDSAQPPGLHRLVHPARARGAGDSDLRATVRKSATSST